VRYASHQHFLAVCKRSGISSPPPLQKKLFPSEPPSEGEPRDKEMEMIQMGEKLKAMTEQLERSRALMDLKLADLQAREDNLQSTIQSSVNQALKDFIKNNPMTYVNADDSSDPLKGSVPAAVAVRPDAAHDSNSAINMIRGSSNLLARLMSRVQLPQEFKDERHEVATVVDFFFRSMKKYDMLNDVFAETIDGADLILSVHKFRDLFESYKQGISPDLLDWLTLFALSSKNEVLFDKVSASLKVACSVKFVDRQTLFNTMMSSGVLPDIGPQSDILESVGARELFLQGSSAIALKSICNFVVSYCGHFDDILSRAQDAKKDFIEKRYDESPDCQARFSAELKAYNSVMVWYGGDFMLPLERAQLFLSKSPVHVKRQYADEHELRIGMSWQQFVTKMASAWSVAFKKRRMMIDIGLDVSENEPIPAEIPAVTDAPAASVPPVPPVSAGSFNSDVNDIMVDIKCKQEGCTTSFPYSSRKIVWLRNHFGENFRMPSRCAVHKAAADAERDKDRSGSSPENPVPENQVPAVPAKNRFGSRRSPNVDQ
jgi:hypothetical protein